MSVLENYQPQKVWHYFEEICGIPHGSGDTARISDHLAAFAKERGMRYVQDELNNVIIYKDGTPGYESAPTVILQGHMDMVCEKRPDVVHDFTKDGLKLGVDGDFLHANGTTLGGDDGIAVAMGLALLDSDDIPHPPLEIVITVDEEIGLLGAAGLDCSVLKGRKMINLDSEKEGGLWVSCAGGLVGETCIPVRRVEGEGLKLCITVTGLLGGHSGAEIDKIRGNASKLMGRVLFALSRQNFFAITELSGGSKDNAIPRECVCRMLIAEEEKEEIFAKIRKTEADLQKEYAGSDEGLRIEIAEEGIASGMVLHPGSQSKVLFFLENLPNGVHKMSGTLPGLVETSSNLGILELQEDCLLAHASIRSSVLSARDAISDRIEFLTEFLGGEYEVQGAYPAWEYRRDSALRDLMTDVWKELYGTELAVVAIHAGLECGLFHEKMDGLDCVSLGPDIFDIHTSEERLSISSVERVWKYLLEVLRRIA